MLIASVVSYTGCGGSRAGSYPDRSESTARQVDEINRQARAKKDAADAEHDRLSARMDFEERQIRQKYKAERQKLDNEFETEATSPNAKMRDIQIRAKHDKEAIDAEVAEKLKTSSPEKADDLRAESARRKAEIDRKTTAEISEITNEAERSKAEIAQRKLELSREESHEISALEKKRAKARNERNDKMLNIDQWTNRELSKVANGEIASSAQ